MDTSVPQSEQEWREKLTEEEYRVLRGKGTETPGSGKYLYEKQSGTYTCAACGNPLFASNTKFDSGTGWPSFDQALPGAVEMQTDENHGTLRTEVICAQCKSHLGHVFNDGPRETTGQRFCMNSVCLDLKSDEQ